MSIEQPHILVVDDNPATLYSTSRVLRSAGWTVAEAESGEEALTFLKQNIDLVVLDINLPGIDGFEVCRQIRLNPSTARIPVVHLSATFVNDIHKVHGLEAGADGYLTHPVEPPVLIATVKAFLRTRQAENESQQSQARFKAIFENVVNGVCMLSEDMTITDVNPAICKILEAKPSELIGKRLWDFVPESKNDSFAKISQELLSSNSWQGQFPLQNKLNEIVELEWSISTGITLATRLAILSDVSERLRGERERESLLTSERAARSEAERANRLKDDFLATLSHELRNPLNAMVGWTQLLRLREPSPADLAEGLESIERNALLQAQMINDLLDISRITSGKIRLDLQQVNPNSIIRDAINAVTNLAESKSIRISTSLHSSAAMCADPLRLQQIVWNLVNNAVKFTPENGEVTVSSREINSNIEITVRDSGIGITDGFLPHIFDRFRQADASSTRQHAGLGLGLAIVKQLVEAHGGTISVESNGVNQGAIFTVLVPVVNQHGLQTTVVNEIGEIKSRPEVAADLSGVRVMIVEDDFDSRELLRRVLLAAGADASTHESAASALEQISLFKPHILMSDLGMPHQDGYYLIKELRNRGFSNSDLPAIALTAFVGEEDRSRALKEGFQGFIGKPVNSSELTKLIGKFVQANQLKI